MSVPWWLPPAGLDRVDELASLERSLEMARGITLGLLHARDIAHGRTRRRIAARLSDAIYERDVIDARVQTIRGMASEAS